MSPVYLFCIALPIFILLDLLWLGFLAKDFYQTQLEGLLGPVRWSAAILFYLVFIVGLTFFASLPGLQSGEISKTVMLGAIFGFVAYATYDLTNLATLANWSMSVTIVDIIWGAFIGGATAGTAVFVYTLLFT